MVGVEIGEKLTTKRFYRMRLIISIVALAFAGIRLFWPSLVVDGVALTLLVVAALPWLAPLVKSMEFPGGFKVELLDLQEIASRADSVDLLADKQEDGREPFSFELVASQDPNLALAGLRIEIERRLTLLARASGTQIDHPMGICRLLAVLTSHGFLTEEERSVLADMTSMLNAAVHGSDVDQRAADWALDVGSRLLLSLDERTAEASET